MPTIPYSIPFDVHQRVACAGKWTDDESKLEKIKKSFNDVHNWIRESMDLNFRFFDVVIAKLKWAMEEFETHQEEFDHRALITELRDSILGEFDKFWTPYSNAEDEMDKCVLAVHRAIYPFEANSFLHYINDLDKGKLNEMIVTHLYRQGLFDIGDELISDAKDGGLMDKMTDMRTQFKHMHAIIKAVRRCETELPLQWISDNRERLGEVKASEMEYKVHVMMYISIVEDSGDRNEVKLEALNYAKTHLARFVNEHDMNEMKKLIGCVFYESYKVRLVGDSRYCHLFDGTYKRSLVAEIERQFYLMMGQCVTDPLRTVTSVGVKVVSGVCKVANYVQEDEGCGWAALDEIPLYLKIDDEFKFHSQFACPATQDLMQTGLSPPIALSCGHVVGLQRLIGQTSWDSFSLLKCPFCIAYTTHNYCKTVYF